MSGKNVFIMAVRASMTIRTTGEHKLQQIMKTEVGTLLEAFRVFFTKM
jgi:hypothetical protein